MLLLFVETTLVFLDNFSSQKITFVDMDNFFVNKWKNISCSEKKFVAIILFLWFYAIFCLTDFFVWPIWRFVPKGSINS